MNIGLCLRKKFPNANPFSDYVVADSGSGQHISEWKLADPQPTQTELESMWLDVLKEHKILDLNRSCNLEILKGFVSASTGHTYEFGMLDQTNMDQQMGFLMRRTDVLEVKWNTKNAGEVIHTRDQFFTVCDEAANFKWQQVSKYRSLKKNVIDALTEADVNAITW